MPPARVQREKVIHMGSTYQARVMSIAAAHPAGAGLAGRVAQMYVQRAAGSAWQQVSITALTSTRLQILPLQARQGTGLPSAGLVAATFDSFKAQLGPQVRFGTG